MADPVVYPITLPGPEQAPVVPNDRAIRYGSDPRESASFQRDFAGTQDLRFRFTADQAAVFQAWWQTALVYGGLFFAADWPLPAGVTTAVRRFLSPPSWQHVANGTWDVSAKVEIRGAGVLPNYYPLVPPVTCDCSHTAWQANFESGSIVDPDVPALIGSMIITSGVGAISISSDDALFGTKSLKFVDSEEAGYVEFVTPAVSLDTAWTANFSLKTTASTFEFWSAILTAWSTTSGSSGEKCRVEFRESSGSGDLQFFVFDATTFTSGSGGGYSYNTRYDFEFRAGEGRLMLFINGTRVLNNSSSANTGVVRFRLAVSSLAPDQVVLVDEIRVTNQIEHTEDYTPVLPFCTC